MYIQAVGFSVKKRQVVNIRKRQKGVVENQNHISEANHVESMGTLIQQVMYCLPNHSGQRICGKGIPGLQRAISNNEGRLTDKEQTDEESTFAQQLETKLAFCQCVSATEINLQKCSKTPVAALCGLYACSLQSEREISSTCSVGWKIKQ